MKVLSIPYYAMCGECGELLEMVRALRGGETCALMFHPEQSWLHKNQDLPRCEKIGTTVKLKFIEIESEEVPRASVEL